MNWFLPLVQLRVAQLLGPAVVGSFLDQGDRTRTLVLVLELQLGVVCRWGACRFHQKRVDSLSLLDLRGLLSGRAFVVVRQLLGSTAVRCVASALLIHLVEAWAHACHPRP